MQKLKQLAGILSAALVAAVVLLSTSPAGAETEVAGVLESALATERVIIDTSAPQPWPLAGNLTTTELLAELAHQDVVVLGEYHDSDTSHLLQLELLWRIQRANERGAVLSLEQFERDVQHLLGQYAFGFISEEEFLADSRPWPNYDPHYRPLIELAISGWMPIVASNIPRPLASRVAKEGFEAAWDGYSATEREWIAEYTTHPEDAYWGLFSGLMGGGGHGGGMDPEMVRMFYAAQCIKDDTMAESIVRALELYPGRTVVHTVGSFHMDYNLGMVPRITERNPAARVATVALRPVRSWDEVAEWDETLPDDAAVYDITRTGNQVADYILFVPGPYFGLSDEEVAELEAEQQAAMEAQMPPPADGGDGDEAPPMPPMGADDTEE